MLDLEIWPGAEQYWEAFHRLNRGRMRDMGEVQPLREVDLFAHAAAFGFTDLEEFYEMIRALDQTYVEFYRSRKTAVIQVSH